MNRLTTATLIVVFVVSVSPNIHAQVITNGDFESPVIPPSSSSLFDVIPGWTPVVGFFEIQSNFFLGTGLGTPSGNQYLELNAMGPSTIRTFLFATNPGQEYVVRYLFAANPVGPTMQTIGLTFTGSAEVTDSRVNGSIFEFTPSVFNFIATSSMSSLTLRAVSTGDSGNLIDAVSITPVPEPASLVCGLIGALAMAIVSRKEAGRQIHWPISPRSTIV